ncbi:thioredoxin [Methanomassiliicoccus luminyensis]|jgi:thioredoxin 1|uniref:thioredoxin n=1 Tax=Methanomassiliicoccus luminyensis TaxID=1080712 RepID=UPI00036DD72F|nr:thioredoxin [Methanomassiliicoccus luminyensis]
MDELQNIREKKRQELEKAAEWPSEPVEVRDDNFNDFLKKHKVAVVDCWAPWCGPCRAMGPVIDALAAEMKGQAAFGKLNTDENPKTSMRFQIEAIPTLLVFREGELVDRHVGARPKDDLKRRLTSRL